jgi:hypothetical protein
MFGPSMASNSSRLGLMGTEPTVRMAVPEPAARVRSTLAVGDC